MVKGERIKNSSFASVVVVVVELTIVKGESMYRVVYI